MLLTLLYMPFDGHVPSFSLGIDCCSLLGLHFPVLNKESAIVERVGVSVGLAPTLFFSQLLSSASLAVQCLEIVVLYILSSFHSCSWLELKVLSYSLIDLDITSSEKTFTKLDSSCLCRCFSS